MSIQFPVAFVGFQLVPPLRDWKMPCQVAARIVFPSGEIASRLTYSHGQVAGLGHTVELVGSVLARWFQLTPLFVDLKTPCPCIPSGVNPFPGFPVLLAKDSPVPAYMVLGIVGLITIVDTARLAKKSLTGNHEVPPLSVRQMPPPTLPTHMVLVFVG